MASVLCVGIATLDYVYAVPQLPSQGTKYRATALEVVGGGIAANASVAVARLGGKAWLLTRLGDDVTGQAIRSGLAADAVDLALSQAIGGCRSPVSAIMVDQAGERMIVSYSDPAMPAQPDWLPQALPVETGAVLGDTRWEEGALRLFRNARMAGLPAVLDGDRKPHDPGLLAAATHVAFSEVGLAEQTGLSDPRAALLSLGSGEAWLAVTAGARGVWIRDKGEVVHVPAFTVDVVDTLGAGDVWHGAFALALAERQSERQAVRFANAAAAIKCTRFGGRKGAPTRTEVEQFLRERP
ncbi:MAG: PfkB family carbohydrate kinase [Hyphomicrobiales bacterium]|jgi:sulfofructose kinase|nr:PfkB family carbohydrate kinase [Hyphomicrobiales bacterium]